MMSIGLWPPRCVFEWVDGLVPVPRSALPAPGVQHAASKMWRTSSSTTAPSSHQVVVGAVQLVQHLLSGRGPDPPVEEQRGFVEQALRRFPPLTTTLRAMLWSGRPPRGQLLAGKDHPGSRPDSGRPGCRHLGPTVRQPEVGTAQSTLGPERLQCSRPLPSVSRPFSARRR